MIFASINFRISLDFKVPNGLLKCIQESAKSDRKKRDVYANNSEKDVDASSKPILAKPQLLSSYCRT